MPTPSQSTYTLVSPPTPGLDPPPGVIPTFHQPYTLRPYAELTIALGIIITTCLVMARIFVKARVVRKFLWEDYTCILGWVSLHVFVSAPCGCEHQLGTCYFACGSIMRSKAHSLFDCLMSRPVHSQPYG